MAGLIQDVSQRKSAELALQEERHILEVLNKTGTALNSNLDLRAIVQAVTDAGTELSGAKFGAFFYNTRDEASGDAYMLYTLSGAPRDAFEHLGKPRATPVFGPTFERWSTDSIRRYYKSSALWPMAAAPWHAARAPGCP